MKDLNFKITFWKLQLTGWFLFLLLMIEERFRYDDDFLIMTFIGFLITGVGFLCSLLLRWVYGKIAIDRWSFPSVILLMIITSLVCGYFWADVTAYYIVKYDLLKEEVTPDWYRQSAWERNLIVIIFLWNSMYFGIKYWQKSLEENTKRLQAEFDAEKSLIEQERIQKELNYKNKELMTKTLYLAKHNELLFTVSNLIEKSEEMDGGKSREILSKINESLHIEDQWKEFDLWFNEVHQEFYDTLREKFSELSLRDLKICAFLKLKLSTKEIADLTNLTIGTIEQYRTKLRKKLGMSEGENIQLFLDSL